MPPTAPQFFRLALAFALATLAEAIPAQTPPWEDFEAARFATVEEVESTGLESRLRVRFEPPGTDRLPSRAVRVFWLAGPPGEKLSVTIHSMQWSLAGADGATTGPLTLEESSSGATSQLLRDVRTRLVDQFRGVGMYRAEVPLSATQTIATAAGPATFRVVLGEALLDVKLSEPDEARPAAPMAEADPWGYDVLRRMVANPGQIASSAVAHAPSFREEDLLRWNTMLADAETRAPLLMARLTRGGLYSLTGEHLSAAGWSVGSIPADSIRIFAGGDELAPLPVGVARNRLLTARERLVFHVPHDRTGLEPYIPLWVVAGDGPARRSALVPPLPRERQRAAATVTAERRVLLFEPNEYHHEQPLTAPQLRWATATLAPGTFRRFEFESHHALSAAQASIEVVAMNASRDTARLDFLLNGAPVGGVTPAPMRTDSSTVSFPTSLLRNGTNVLTVSNPRPDADGKGSPVRFIQAELRLPVETLGPPVNEPMTLANDEPSSVTISLRRHEMMGRTTLAVDVTDPLAPRFHEFSAMQVSGTHRFEGDIDLPTPRAVLIQAPAENADTLPPLEKVPAPRVFLSAAPVDYLVVAHPTLEAAIAPLAQRRARHEAVEVVTTEEVYRAFSHGRVSFEAIADCVEALYHRRSAPRLRSVLLVGEASESWWEWRAPSDKVERNLLPVYGWRDRVDRLRSDDGYSRFSGRGSIPDVELARISARTPEQVRGVVEKIARYEDTAAPGDWLNRNVFVMDDESEFRRVASRIVNRTFRGPHVPRFLPLEEFVYENYFRGIWRKRSVIMTDAIVDAFNQGAFTMTYLGHGGPNLWSEERIFHIRDIDRTENDGSFPILTAGSCDTGWLDYPVEPVNTSLSEHFLRRPNGGAVAAYVPLGATSSYEHDFILSGFYRALFERGSNRLGELALMSKMDYYLDRTNESVTQQYALMGDPAMSVRRAAEMPEAGVIPARLLSATGGQLKVGGLAPGIDWGMGTATLLSPTGLPLADARFRVRNGAFEEIIPIPAHLEPGEYRVALTASNESRALYFSRAVPLSVRPAAVRLEWRDPVPADAIRDAGGPREVAIDIHNDADADLIGAEFQVLEATTGARIIAVPVSVPAGGTISPRFARRLPPQVASIAGRLVAGGGSAGLPATVLAEATSIVPRAGDHHRFISFPAGAVEVRRLADDAGTQFRLPVFNLTAAPLEGLVASLRWQGRAEVLAIGEPQPLGTIAPGDRVVAEFSSPRRFPGGAETFVLEVRDGGDGPPMQVEAFTLGMRQGPDLRVVPGSLHAESGDLRAGNTVFFRFRVRNDGNATANGVTAALFHEAPWREDRRARNSVPWVDPPTVARLAPGEERELRLRWDPEDNTAGARTLHLAVSCAASDAEENLADNVDSITVTMASPPNLAIGPGPVLRSREFALPHDRVRFTAPIVNDSANDFLRSFRVVADAISLDGTRERIFSTRMERLLAGESSTIQFDWVVKEGQSAVEVTINEDREFLETSFDDNTRRLDFASILGDSWFASGSGAWDFSDFSALGRLRGVHRLPQGGITVDAVPREEVSSSRFLPEYLVSGSLGHDTAPDGRWGLRDGMLFTSFAERVTPVGFRIPLDPASGTTYYTLVINSVGDVRPDQMSGHFRYRLEGALDWVLEDRRQKGSFVLGRVETRDNHLDIEIDGPPYPAFNHLLSVNCFPVLGIFESPIVRHRRAPRGSLVTRESLPGGTRIEYAVRHGRGDGSAIQWGGWQPATAGAPVPAAGAGDEFLQWRARLYGSAEGMPTLRSAAIELEPGSFSGWPAETATDSAGGGQ